jgi:hypothetical protein
MIKWKDILASVKEDANYEFLPISGTTPPDLNVLVFTVKAKNCSSFEKMNKLTKMIYDKYSIQAELGDKKYSYSQPFFLSKTPFSSPNYNFSAFADFLEENGIIHGEKDYKEHGIVVLRATLMNPYIHAYEKHKDINLIKDFIVGLHKNANELSTKL